MDRSQIVEVEQFNSLMSTYQDLLFGKIEQKPESKKDKIKNMEGQFNTLQKQALDNNLMSNLVVGNPTEAEISTVDIKEFYNKIVGE
ncbi:MAG TPA: hypothetical protein PKN48_00470 [Bacteroidales bacterium]|nr:hypothetical protein [Bacteroidales bacterium]